MMARTPFWPLLRHGLGFLQFGFWPAFCWLLGSLAVVFFLVSPNYPETFFHERSQSARIGDGIIGCTFLAFIWLWLTFSDILTQLANSGATRHVLEFMWTRAIDRRMAHRAGSVAAWILFIGPLILNLLISPLAPDAWIDPSEMAGPAGQNALARYQAIFGHADLPAGPASESTHLAIHNGQVYFDAWMCWMAMLSFVGFGVYWAGILRPIQRNVARFAAFGGPGRILLDLIVYAPMFLLPITPIIIGLISRINVYEESFLFFSAHWLAGGCGALLLLAVTQLWLEKEVCKLELL